MINEVLDLIVNAEAKAQEILENANVESGKIASESSVTCAEIGENAVKQAKEERAKIIEESEVKAQSEYDRIIEKSKQDAVSLLDEKGETADHLGAEIFGRIVNGNC